MKPILKSCCCFLRNRIGANQFGPSHGWQIPSHPRNKTYPETITLVEILTLAGIASAAIGFLNGGEISGLCTAWSMATTGVNHKSKLQERPLDSLSCKVAGNGLCQACLRFLRRNWLDPEALPDSSLVAKPLAPLNPYHFLGKSSWVRAF